MALIQQVYLDVRAFVSDYIKRHNHPVNAWLHLIGVPMTVWAIYWLVSWKITEGLCCLVGGYFLQYLGHRAQGNEVGEVMLIKGVWRRLKTLGGQPHD
ncbi:MAG: DUF962 domain-containing protein [Candidatus Melainabacteria bacterium]|nr:DUF962 domain-containing protein [Candidatus Melainabacteria bacterium]